MIYIFDKKQAIIKVLTNDDFTAAHLNFKINTATTFEFSLPASKALPSGSKYVATPHPLNDSKFIMLRLTERVDKTETIDYSAYELAYQELATDGYIEDKRPQNQSALNLMKIALDGSNWELNNVNVSGTATTNFYYVDRLSAISKVVDLLGGEIVFYIEIQGNAISGRYMDYLARQGSDTSKVFASGSNLLTVERQSDTSGIYTAILPRGKGKEIDNGEADTPDGYGRRINIADVEWKKSEGKPLDKPKGSIVLSDPDATAEWGQINGNARLLLQTYDDIDDVNVLINSAYKTLQSVNHPQIQYSATVADVGGLSLGDTVLIMHGDRDLSYKTRVFEVKYDLLSPDQTELSLGDDLSSNSITSQINNLNAVADTTSSQTQWTINQIGRPSTTFGSTEPANPKVGDVFFKELPDGGTKIYHWNGDIWELRASPTTADDIDKAVNDAVTQAKAHTDEVKQGLSSDIETAKSQAASLASTAEANAKSEAVSQFNRAERILSDAKKDLMESIASEASARDQAVAAANSKAQNYVNQAKKDINDTINALSVGGRNYIINSDISSGTTLTDKFFTSVGAGVFSNKVITLSVQVDYDNITNLSGNKRIGFLTFLTKTDGNNIWFGAIKYPNLGDSFHGRISVTTDLTNINVLDLNSNKLPLGILIDGVEGSNVSVSRPKLEIGNKSTDWTTAPEDVVLDYTTKDNKIKETITQYKETNDEKIRKAQTDATTALGLVETKVSQTDYDKKTGDLATKYTQVKQTADSQATDIADIKKTATSQASKINSISSDVDGTKQSISDIEKTQHGQSDKINQITNDVNGTKQSITDIQTKDGKQDTRMGTIETSVSGVKSDFSSYKTTNDGVVKTAQTTAQTAVDGLKTKISQTDFNQKTGEISRNANEAKDTADKALRTIGDYQTSNDKRVHEAESSIERTANSITEKVSQTDYDKKTGELSHDLSELKQTAEGFEATVSKVNNLSVGGRNLYLNSRVLADGYGVNGNVRATVEPFDSTTNMWHIVAAQGTGAGVGIYIWDYGSGKIPDNSDWSYSADVKGTGKAVTFGIERDSNKPVKGTIGSTWSRISQTGHVNEGVKHVVMYFDTSDSPLDVYIKLPKLETGNIPTDWTPAPEDTVTALAQVKVTADGISKFVRDSSGNISSDFQTALSKTSIITGSTLATSIQKQTATQITSALTDNNGKIISLINQDSSGVQIAGKNIVLNGDTTVTGTFKVSQANIANGAIGTAQIGDAAITSAKIANLDVSKITGNVTNFIQSNWNGVYESTTITNNGMQIVTSDITTSFGPRGIKLTQGGESVGGIGVSSYVEMPTNFQGIAFNLDGTGDYMTWSARDSGVTTGDYTTKLAWFRSSYKPIGQNAGFNFSTDSPVTFWGDIYGRENTEPLKIASFGMHGISAGGIGHGNGSSAITFGGDGEVYIVSGGQYYKLAQFVKALQPIIGLGTWSAPKNINSSGTVTQWTNITT